MYYDGTKLLNLKDLNKETPEIFISTSNRSAGKTTYFNRKLVSDFLKHKKKFILLYRFAYELNGVADKFFSEIGRLFFPQYIMIQESRERDTFVELFLQDIKDETNKIPCGYALSINKADNIKKCSHLLADGEIMLFDEFQSESSQYAPNEVQKFQSIHTSIARGGGKQVRYLPVIMISNFVSLLNPYYTALHISERLQENTSYLRGEGWVLEQGFNDDASKAQKGSGFNRAFGESDYNKFSSEKFYLNDNNTFVKQMKGTSSYAFSLHYEGNWYGVRYYTDQMIIYVSKNYDQSFPRKYAVQVSDMTNDTILLKAIPGYVMKLRDQFDQGKFRFQDLNCKAAIFTLLSY